MAMSVPMFLSINGIAVGGFTIMYMYLFGMGIVAMAFICFLISPNVKRGILSFRYSVVLSLPYLWSILYSLLFWAITLAAFRVITRGLFYVVYQLIAIVVAASTVYMFGKKAIFYQFLGLMGANIIVIIQMIREYGLMEFIEEYKNVVLSFTAETGTIMKIFESSGHCFAVGFFILYLLLNIKKIKGSILWLILSVFFFFLGLKRIVIMAVVMAVIIGLLANCFLKKNVRRKILIITSIIAAMAFMYIIAVRMGLYDWIQNTLGIETMGRDWIASQIKDWYEIGIGYLGKGVGYISGSIEIGDLDLSRSDGYYVADIHNDLLRQYIELGFIGYIVWSCLFLQYRASYFCHDEQNEDDRRHGILTMSALLLLFFTYATDNTIYYYHTTLFFAMVVMCYKYDEYAEKIKLPGD